MIRLGALSSVIFSSTLLLFASSTFAQTEYKVSVTDVTEQYRHPVIIPTPTPGANKPTRNPTDPGGIAGDDDPIPTMDPSPTPDNGGYYPSSTGTVDTIITLGTKIWDFIVTNKPTADYQTLKTSVVPEGITNFTQLTWKRTDIITKVYHVEFTTITGKSAGGFDYRINFLHSGSLKGKGKYIGQLSVSPANVKLHTDRSLTFRAEVLDPLNFGTEEDPIAGIQLQVTWSSPTTVRYSMNSAEYMMFGDGEIQELPSFAP